MSECGAGDTGGGNLPRITPQMGHRIRNPESLPEGPRDGRIDDGCVRTVSHLSVWSLAEVRTQDTPVRDDARKEAGGGSLECLEALKQCIPHRPFLHLFSFRTLPVVFHLGAQVLRF